MILFLTRSFDTSSDKIIQWLNYYGERNIVRINEEDKIYLKKIELSNKNKNIVLKTKNSQPFNLSEIRFFFYRGGHLHLEVEAQPNIEKELSKYYNREIRDLRDYIAHKLESKNIFGNYFKRTINKLIFLEIAIESGLKIPDSQIIRNKKQLKKALSSLKEKITKPISDVFSIFTDHNHLRTLTAEINPNILEIKDEYFFPSFIQENIEKDYEIRVFFFDQEMFAVAIFSQLSEATKVDFRNHSDFTKRIVPFDIPNILRHNIRKFIKKSGLNTGSIDLIASKDNFFFLEVNPGGQFNFVSICGNYHIEKKIAEYILKKHG